MSGRTFHIEFKTSNGDLHVQPKGDFDGASAWELLNFLHDQYSGQGCVVIDTSHLQQLHPFGCAAFKCALNRRRLPPDRLRFEGAKGVELAPDGSTVIGPPDTTMRLCHDDCANCPCAGDAEPTGPPM